MEQVDCYDPLIFQVIFYVLTELALGRIPTREEVAEHVYKQSGVKKEVTLAILAEARLEEIIEDYQNNRIIK